MRIKLDSQKNTTQIMATKSYLFERYFEFYRGRNQLNCILSRLPGDIFLTIFSYRFIYWKYVTPNLTFFKEDMKYVGKSPLAKNPDWDCACIGSEPNLEEYHIQLDLPGMELGNDNETTACAMLGLSTFDEVQIDKPNSNTHLYAYNRGYYAMLWRERVTFYSKNTLQNGQAVPNCPKVGSNSRFSVRYDKKNKVIEFRLDGVLLEKTLTDIDWKEEDYYIVGLFCCEKDGFRLID
jgi:hypothetical protein